MKKRDKFILTFILIFLNFFLGLAVYSHPVLGQISGESLLVSQEFSLLEYADYQDENFNVDSINVTLPSAKWHIKGLELNITDIKLGEQILPIEEGTESSKSVSKTVKGYGVQLNITEDILLLGVYIYGYYISDPKSPVYVQINGYNAINNLPNSTIYGEPTAINLQKDTPNWSLQEFTEPILLSKGNYYLVVNGSAFLTFDNSKYYWYLNDQDPIQNFLYTARLETDGSTWSFEAQGEPFCHKLIQRTEKSYSPESIEMGVELNHSIYNISNGINPNTGYINISDVDIAINDTNLILPISHNQTVSIMFNTSYNLNLQADLSSYSTNLISIDYDNQWTVNLPISRECDNYSIKFNFPSNWYNIMVKRDNEDITSLIEINEIANYIFISNEIILNEASWEITASSPKIEFEILVERTQFYPGQELKFFIAEPPLNGNYTLILEDPFNDVVYNISKLIPPSINSFTYTIPSNSLDGTYKAFIYWHNNTAGGVIFQEFNIILPFTIDWSLIINTSIIIGLITMGLISSIILIRKQKRKKTLREQQITNRFMDILNLNYIIVIEKRSSLSVYDQIFTEQMISTTLISGFLEAIRAFGIDLSGMEDQSQTIRLEYHNNKVLMSDYKSFRLIFIMKELPSAQFYKLIDNLSHEMEQKFGDYLENFKGNLGPFKEIEDLLKKHLGTSFLYPLKIIKTGKTKITAIEKSMISRAQSIMKKKGTDYFYVVSLIERNNFRSKEIASVFSLIDKKVFTPLI